MHDTQIPARLARVTKRYGTITALHDVDVVLQPGEMSLHHVLLFHGSEPNRSPLPRIGFAIRYVPTHVRQLSPIRDSALLVRGNDAYGHFEHERSPERDLHPDAVARHGAIIDRQLRILYAGAQARGKLNPAARPGIKETT